MHGPVIRVAFIDDNRLLVLTQFDENQPGQAALYLLTHAGPRWTRAQAEPARSRPPGARPAGRRLGPLPGVGDPVGLAVDEPGPGSCYVTFGVGQNEDPEIDPVWWFDGSHWWPCRFDATSPTPR